jgi:hypothetical protein
VVAPFEWRTGANALSVGAILEWHRSSEPLANAYTRGTRTSRAALCGFQTQKQKDEWRRLAEQEQMQTQLLKVENAELQATIKEVLATSRMAESSQHVSTQAHALAAFASPQSDPAARALTKTPSEREVQSESCRS